MGTKKSICRAGTPWENYNAILTEHQAGPLVLAEKSGPEHAIVAIKEAKAGQEECIRRLNHYSHPNLVALSEAFFSKQRCVYGL